jgi:hypothetical protein
MRRGDAELRSRLRTVRAPDEAGAAQRAWTVASAAYAERQTVARPRRRRRVRLGVVPIVAVIAGVLALTPAGAAVHSWIDRTLGVKHASRELFALPAPGRILVSGAGGTWTVATDGSKRRLGGWGEASWSPRGIYIAVAGRDELAAVDAAGTPQWTIGRPEVRFPRWFGPNGYRVAYLSARTLRVIAGDGRGDRELAGSVAGVAPAWRPAHLYELAYATSRGAVAVRDADTGRLLFSRRVGSAPRLLSWSVDGSRLLVLTARGAVVYDGSGRVLARPRTGDGQPPRDAALAPAGDRVALLGSRSLTLTALPPLKRSTRLLFSGNGLRQVAFSPDGRWLLVSWPAADQWIFVRAIGAPRIEASSRIAEQFSAGRHHGGFPRLEGWCCTTSGSAG